MKRRDVTLRQLRVLAALKGHPEASLRELGELLDCTHVAVLQHLRALERGGYVTPSTRTVTRAGLEALRVVIEELESELNRLQAA